MRNIAEFRLIGRVGSVKKVGSTTRVTIASNYGHKDEHGDWKDVAYWNEITIFGPGLQSYVDKHIGQGDLVHAHGRIRQTTYEKDGQRIYAVSLICTELGRLAQASENKPDRDDQASAGQMADADIPF